MHLRIRSREGENNMDMHFDDIFSAVLPNSEEFPNLTDMTLDVSAGGFVDRATNLYVHGRITIPFSKMPKLRYLVLKTFSSEVSLVPDGMALPSIRTLALRDCYQIQKPWVVPIFEADEGAGWS